MIYLDHLIVKTYGGLHISTAPEMSGGGTQPPPKPHAPTKPPAKKPKKK